MSLLTEEWLGKSLIEVDPRRDIGLGADGVAGKSSVGILTGISALADGLTGKA
jgi:hypothetical protein